MGNKVLPLKYVPLTFINTDDSRKYQILNTIFFKHILTKFQNPKTLSTLITKSQYGYTTSAKESGSYRLLRITDINHGKVDWDNLPFCECEAPEKYLLKPGDILIARTGNNISYLVGNDVRDNIVFASYLIRFSCSSDLMPEYLYRFLNSYAFWSQILAKQRGALLQNVNANRMGELLVPYCSIADQKKYIDGVNIDSILQEQQKTTSLFNKVNSIIKGYSSQTTYLKQLRNSILQDAIEGKLTEYWRKRNLNEERWKIKEFFDFFVLQRGYDLVLSKLSNGSIPVITSAGISGYHNIIKAHAPGVATGRSGSVGKVYYIEDDFWPHNTTLFVKDFKGNLQKYVYYFLLQFDITKYSTRSAVPTLNRNNLRNIFINVPPINEQHEIVRRVETLLAMVDELEKQVNHRKALADDLMQAVLREAFEGANSNV